MLVHRWQYTPTQEELDSVQGTFGDLAIPDNFVATVTPYSEGAKVNNRAGKYNNICVRLLGKIYVVKVRIICLHKS